MQSKLKSGAEGAVCLIVIKVDHSRRGVVLYKKQPVISLEMMANIGSLEA